MLFPEWTSHNNTAGQWWTRIRAPNTPQAPGTAFGRSASPSTPTRTPHTHTHLLSSLLSASVSTCPLCFALNTSPRLFGFDTPSWKQNQASCDVVGESEGTRLERLQGTFHSTLRKGTKAHFDTVSSTPFYTRRYLLTLVPSPTTFCFALNHKKSGKRTRWWSRALPKNLNLKILEYVKGTKNERG